MLRSGANLAARLGSSLPALASTGGEAAAAAGSSTALRSLAALNLQMTDAWRSASGSHSGPAPHAHFGVRHFSFFPRSGSDAKAAEPQQTEELADTDQAFGVAEQASASGTASAAAGASSAAEIYSPDAILDASAAAEVAALAQAVEGAWAPTRALDYALTGVHSFTGLPWWLSIMLTTVGIRSATLPLMLMQVRNTYGLTQARPEIEKLLENLKEEQARGNTKATADYQKQVMGVWQKHKANPMKSVASLLVQAPLFIGFFSALRGLAVAKVPSLTEGGALWFTDLTVADPTYALPIIASATFLLTIEAGAADGMEGQPDQMKKRMKNIMRGVAVVIVPFTLNLPAAVFMYWTASNTFSLVQTLVLKVPAVKKILGLPDLKKAAASAGAGAGAEAGKPVLTFTQKPKARRS